MKNFRQCYKAVRQAIQKRRRAAGTDAQSGEIMIEAMIVTVFTVFVLFMILEMSFFLYQQLDMVITANDTAVRMAQTYRFVDSDYLIGFVTPEDITTVNPYRYLVSGVEQQYNNITQEKCTNLAKYRLSKTSLLEMQGNAVISTNVVYDAAGRRHLELTVTATYKVPLLSFLKFFSVDNISRDGTYTMTAKAKAECPDIIDYISTVNYANQVLSMTFKSTVADFINQILKTATSLKKAMT